jgi:exonuclease SbcC
VKPLSLRLRGFGAYADEQIVPFAELAELGLFAVTGPTGSGKTTLFDAMAYALYGGLPGDRPANEVRSHHAAPDTVTEVCLDFQVAGERWRVERTPEQTVMGARKVRKQAAEARLYRWSGAGWQGVETGPRRVDPRVEELVGLTLHQFERVILLPQGKFQQFLLSGTKERRLLLRHLFGTELYERAVDALATRAAARRDQLAASDEAVRHHVTNASTSVVALTARRDAGGGPPPIDDLVTIDADVLIPRLRADLESVQPAVTARERTVRDSEAEHATVQLAAQRAADLAERWQRRASWLRRRDVHEQRRTTIDAQRVAAEAARRAAPVVDAAAAAGLAREQFATACRQHLDAVADLHASLDAAGITRDPGATGDVDAGLLAARVAATQGAASAIAEHRDAITALNAADAELIAVAEGQQRVSAEGAATNAEIAIVTEQAAVHATAAEQVGARELAAADAARVLRQRQAFADAEQQAERAVAAAAKAGDLLDTVTRRFIDGIAPRLAAALRPGEPCAVCGAVEHPHPAVGHADGSVGPAELERAQAAAQSAMAAQGRAVSDLHRLRLELGDDADRPLADVTAGAAEAAAALRAAQQAVAAGQECVRRLVTLEATMTRLTADGSRLEVQRARLDERRAQAAATIARLQPHVDDWAGVDLEARITALADARRLLGAAADLDRARTIAEIRDADAQAALTAALGASGFPALEPARAAAVPADRLAALEAGIEAWHHEAREIEAALTALAADELPDEQPDAGARADELARLTTALTQERNGLLRMHHHLEAASSALDAAEAERAASAPIRAEHAEVEVVARTCAGQGPGRIALESWVLATELDRVAAAANVHLGRMSAGRYQLTRTDDAGHAGKQAGLDLAVVDSHTGRQRPTTTLSGGEQFQASLALALGLADVVGNTEGASAAGFEALFVDEGFGALDPDALDLAISALDELRGGGRAVGVITHVEALKAALPVGVEVRPRADGHGSTLTVGVQVG